MKTPLLILILVLGSAPLLQAQSVDDLKVRNRSSFDAPKDGRNPFWPVGWIKAEPAPASEGGARTENPKPVAPAGPSTAFMKPENFIVTSISIGALPLALINGKAYGEGDLIPYPVGGGSTVSVQVVSVRDGVVTLRFRDKTITTTIKTTSPIRQQ